MSEHNENINKIQFRLAVTYRQLSAVVINQITHKQNVCISAKCCMQNMRNEEQTSGGKKHSQ